MDTGLIDVHISPEDLALCTQESFLAPFVPNDLSTDSASTTQLTSGGGPLCYSQSYPLSPAFGNLQAHEFQTTPMAEGCGFFDECPGLYSQPLTTQCPFQNASSGSSPPPMSGDRIYDDLTDSLDPASARTFTKSVIRFSQSPIDGCSQGLLDNGGESAPGSPGVRGESAAAARGRIEPTADHRLRQVIAVRRLPRVEDAAADTIEPTAADGASHPSMWRGTVRAISCDSQRVVE